MGVAKQPNAIAPRVRRERYAVRSRQLRDLLQAGDAANLDHVGLHHIKRTCGDHITQLRDLAIEFAAGYAQIEAFT